MIRGNVRRGAALLGYRKLEECGLKIVAALIATRPKSAVTRPMMTKRDAGNRYESSCLQEIAPRLRLHVEEVRSCKSVGWVLVSGLARKVIEEAQTNGYEAIEPSMCCVLVRLLPGLMTTISGVRIGFLIPELVFH